MTYTDLIYPPSTDDPQHHRVHVCNHRKKKFNPGSRCTLLNMSLISTAQPQHQVQDSCRPSAGLETSHGHSCVSTALPVPIKNQKTRTAANNHTKAEFRGFRTTQASKAQRNFSTLAHIEAHKTSTNSFTDHTHSLTHQPGL